VTGIEDDLPEHRIREFFSAHGRIKSLVCSHMSHCAFINYEARDAAERASDACRGRAVVAGCPLRVRWSVPRAVGTMNKEQRGEMLRDGRGAWSDVRRAQDRQRQRQQEGGGMLAAPEGRAIEGGDADDDGNPDRAGVVAAPPGAGDVAYASLAGN
jgi:pre-mRNA-splicing factor RBM22/SLT11